MNCITHFEKIPTFHQHSMDQQFSNHSIQSSRNSAEMGCQERDRFKFPFISQNIPPLICEFWRPHLQKMFYVLSLNTTNVMITWHSIFEYIYTSTTSLIIDSLERSSELILAWNLSLNYRVSFWSKLAAEIWKNCKRKKMKFMILARISNCSGKERNMDV